MGSPIPTALAGPTPALTAVDTSGPLRRFAESRIQDSINSALAQLEPGAHGAVIAFADKDAVKLATVAKLGPGWSVVMIGERTYKGEWGGEAAVKYQW
jgi:hypothetical protein